MFNTIDVYILNYASLKRPHIELLLLQIISSDEALSVCDLKHLPMNLEYYYYHCIIFMTFYAEHDCSQKENMTSQRLRRLEYNYRSLCDASVPHIRQSTQYCDILVL